MVNLGKVSVGDERTDFQIILEVTDINGNNAVEDISGYTTYDIIVVDPDGVETTLTGSFLTNGADGISRAINTDPTLINAPGIWQYKGYYVDSATGVYTSNPIFFEVLD